MIFDSAFIYIKIDNILRYLKEIKKILKFSDKEINSDFMKFHAEERLFQLIVDAILDINQHIIREKELEGYNGDLQGTFYILGDSKILPNEFAFKIAPIAGMRNRLVHDYGSFDIERFTRDVKENLSDIEKYLKHIDEFLNTKNTKTIK